MLQHAQPSEPLSVSNARPTETFPALDVFDGSGLASTLGDTSK
jgi:hypothetical protein